MRIIDIVGWIIMIETIIMNIKKGFTKLGGDFSTFFINKIKLINKINEILCGDQCTYIKLFTSRKNKAAYRDIN